MKANPIPKSKAYIVLLVLAIALFGVTAYILYLLDFWTHMFIYVPVAWGMWLEGTLDLETTLMLGLYFSLMGVGLGLGLLIVGMHYRFNGYKQYTFGILQGIADRERAGPIKSN